MYETDYTATELAHAVTQQQQQQQQQPVSELTHNGTADSLAQAASAVGATTTTLAAPVFASGGVDIVAFAVSRAAARLQCDFERLARV